MKYLIYGRGVIGNLIADYLISKSYTFERGEARVDDFRSFRQEVTSIKPTHVILAIGRTHIGSISTIDALETESDINVRDNFFAPLSAAVYCSQLNIHVTYIGTGCIYSYDDEDDTCEDGMICPLNVEPKRFKETDIPNFTGSAYSAVKGMTDTLINSLPNVLNARIRMPILSSLHPRGFLAKVILYKDNICSIPNSMSCMDEMIPIIVEMSKHQVTGAVNCTNPGVITHEEILLALRKVMPDLTWHLISEYELANHIAAPRSNNYLDTSRLENIAKVFQLPLTPIKRALERTISNLSKD